MPVAFKFDFFPARAFPLGLEELERAVLLRENGLSAEPVPFVTPEDILLAKLYCFRAGNDVSDIQWRDVLGIVCSRATVLDRAYLSYGAAKLGVIELLRRALAWK